MQLRHKHEWTGNLCRYTLKLFSVKCIVSLHRICTCVVFDSLAVLDTLESPTHPFVCEDTETTLTLFFLMPYAFLLLHNQCNCSTYWMETRQGQLDNQETTQPRVRNTPVLWPDSSLSAVCLTLCLCVLLSRARGGKSLLCFILFEPI